MFNVRYLRVTNIPRSQWQNSTGSIMPSEDLMPYLLPSRHRGCGSSQVCRQAFRAELELWKLVLVPRISRGFSFQSVREVRVDVPFVDSELYNALEGLCAQRDNTFEGRLFVQR